AGGHQNQAITAADQAFDDIGLRATESIEAEDALEQFEGCFRHPDRIGQRQRNGSRLAARCSPVHALQVAMAQPLPASTGCGGTGFSPASSGRTGLAMMVCRWVHSAWIT